MGYMNAIHLEIEELRTMVLVADMDRAMGQKDTLAEDLDGMGWVAPTVAEVAVRAIREKDYGRALALLGAIPEKGD